MVVNNVISDDYLAQIYKILSRYSLGHFVIVAPDGIYGVAFTGRYHVDTLLPGQYVLCPNVYSKSEKGYFDTSVDVVGEAIKIISSDSYGVNRRNVMTYHYKNVLSSSQISRGVDIYASNDNGHGVGRSTALMADNIHYFGTYYSKSKLPQTPNKIKLGTHIFSKTNENIYSITNPVKTSLVGDRIEISYQVKYIPRENPTFKFNLPVNIDFISAYPSKGTCYYNQSSRVLYWYLKDCDETNSFVLTFKATKTGTYTISSSLNDVKYDVKFSVVDYGAVISTKDIEKYYGGSERLKIYLTDINKNPLTGENLKVTVNGVVYNYKINEKGYVTLPLNLNSGDYQVNIVYDGHLGKNTTSSKVKILETLSGDDIVKYFRNSTQYVAKFLDSNGNALSHKSVSFNINGVFYTRNTNGEGFARLNINLNPGNYIITSINSQTNEHYSNNVNVLPILVEGHDLTKYYRNGSAYSIKVLDDLGNPLTNASVKFNINGVFYTRHSNAQGYANLNIKLHPGKYIVTAEYNNYRYSNNVHVLPVLFANNSVSHSNTSDFAVKLIDGNGNPYSNQNITFNINGIVYTNTTGGDGMAQLIVDLVKGEHIVTSTYDEFSINNIITMI